MTQLSLFEPLKRQPQAFETRPRLLRASAGTGKTYQLVEAYAALVLQEGLRPSEIIAISFTRKAAAELRLRIRQRLLDAAAVTPQAALLDLEAVSPVNFHGLCLRLLAEFSDLLPAQQRPLGSPTILGEQQQDALLFFEACEKAWLHRDPQPSACSPASGPASASGTAPALGINYAELPSASALDAAVETVAPYFSIQDALPAALWQALGRAREEGRALDESLFAAYSPEQAQARAHTFLDSLRTTLRCADLPPAKKGEVRSRAAEKIEAFLQQAPSDAAAVLGAQEFVARWRRALQNLDRRGALGKVYSREDQQTAQQLLDCVEAEQLCARLQPALSLLTQAAWRTYGELKAALGAWDFADIVQLTVDLLQRHPEALQRLQGRIRAVLVDEAQDTNALQRTLVYLLAGVAESPNTHSAARLYVVGDWKQSIYTFRGADPRSFNLFAEDLRARRGTEQQLSISRRSAAPLIAGINHLGTHLFGLRYEALQALSDDAASCAKMIWLTEPPSDTPPSLPPAEQEAQRVAAFIEARLAHGAQPGDFAVLMATMTAAPAFAAALRAKNISTLVSGGGDFFAQSEIVDLLSLLHWLVDPTQRLCAAVALRSPLIGLTDATLFALLQSTAVAGDDGLEQLRGGQLPPESAERPIDPQQLRAQQRLAALLPQWLGAAQHMGAVALLQLLEQCLQVRAVYAAVAASPAQASLNLDHLERLAALSDQEHGEAAAPFVRRLQRRRQSGLREPLPQGQPGTGISSVTLSSVHQSKGLQYPVVILAGLGRKGRVDAACVQFSAAHGLLFRPRAHHTLCKSSQVVEANATELQLRDQELRRLLYVAITRAERQVIFLAPQQSSSEGFGGLLHPWQAAAVAAGCLQLVEADALPAAASVLTTSVAKEYTWEPSAEVELDSAPLRPPPGSVANFTVTQLAHTADEVMLSKDSEADGPAGTDSAAVDSAGRVSAAAHSAVTHSDANNSAEARSGSVPSAGARSDAVYSIGERSADPSQRQWGDLAHSVLAQASELTETGLPAIKEFVAARLAALCLQTPANKGDLAKLQGHLIRFLTSKLMAHVLATGPQGRLHEMPFTIQLPAAQLQVTLRGQLDLVYWDRKGAVVLDYKYAHATTENLTAYLLQLDAYAYALTQLGAAQGTVRTYLVFLRDPGSPLLHLATPQRQAQVQQRLHRMALSTPLWHPAAQRLDV